MDNKEQPDISEDDMLNITHSVIPTLIKAGKMKEENLFKWDNNPSKMIYFVPNGNLPTSRTDSNNAE